MELAPGRSIVSSKEASSNRGGSDSGRSGSGRDRALDYRSSGGDKEKPSGGRDYGRESSRSDWDRERERKEWGGSSKGSDKQQQRRRGTVDSRGGSRHYSDSSRQDKGYRYLGHRDRSRWVGGSARVSL